MRVGVICEGPTDYHAIECFIAAALAESGTEVEFVPLQPQMDNTNPVGGWGAVLLWLRKNPPQSRVHRYFGGGIFANELSDAPLDCILIQLDTDVVDDESFRKFVSSNVAHIVDVSIEPNIRARQIRRVIELFGKIDEMTDADKSRHVIAPSVESTESWCVAAFNPTIKDVERIKGQQLVDEFMSALERSESRNPSPPYAEMNKDVLRRRSFCERHAGGYTRIITASESFREALDRIKALQT